ncbi:hypothetical protein A2833_00325 [Candidatus Azambacteria bacterium RIFCSPHIGHO2_01_FULL_44_55]|uniref:Uncharacterized protein n=1 Tax=Candidatus Azambacteria bacterium RIFCSPLOWO2_02_FULL_44_14 TaxID=1797306 RepID=A0A1F5CAC4_9BACT|nr:MAG: hypothetical protein A3A18_02265 [Candidatus Azambacteria bacterium RIFCSPLOWO2_01_FULL_44_84]OGD32835.1 MAG: hypothetical protein A3C78_03495 [Candidatus Azambacteria bacterium RIFCSPHIGHO2_02_FULL_45_18]OGD39801.1 MAG: hypothetical protein A3I30_02260 [Candidatus Azambacteria bacterium RIFCSPLOWO2_02_FULL_44_14]OGD41619.1 MAG: hypothetical protein A2833_00325 [Candidatus Azambacteria bacterium RIFCSPHIGHO2_01_FULL_44_55]
MGKIGNACAVITSHNAEQLLDQLGQAGLINPDIYLKQCQKCGTEIITNTLDFDRCPDPECASYLFVSRVISYTEWNRRQQLAHSLSYLDGQLPSP